MDVSDIPLWVAITYPLVGLCIGIGLVLSVRPSVSTQERVGDAFILLMSPLVWLPGIAVLIALIPFYGLAVLLDRR